MRILLIQTSFLGDVILSTPVISGLKKLYPDAELYVMTTPLAAGLLANHPLIQKVIPFEKRGKHRGIKGLKLFSKELASYQFSKIYSLHRSWRTSLLVRMTDVPVRIGFKDAWGSRWAYTNRVNKAGAGEHAVLRYLSLLFDEKPREFFETKLSLFAEPMSKLSSPIQSILPESYVCLFPGSEWMTKRWQRYRELAQLLIQKGERVLILGSKKEAEENERQMSGIPVVHLSGKTSLAETISIVSKAKGVVCNDSMALHMASAFEVPRVSVFCATSPSFGFGPWGAYGKVEEVLDLPCKPCRRHGSQSCPTGTNRCMTGVEPKDVLLSIESVMKQKATV